MSGDAQQGAPAVALGERRPTLGDVARGYRLFLGRELESASVAGYHIARATSLWDLIETIWRCPEAEHRRMGEALGAVAGFHRPSIEETVATDDELSLLYRLVAEAWDVHGFGRYDGWLRRNEPRYAERSARWKLDRILEAGRDEARDLLDLCARHDFTLDREKAVAVLGAEAFRLIEALAPLASAYHNLEMLEKEGALVGRAIASLRIDNVTPKLIRGREMRMPAMDLFYSVRALQYAPPPMMLDLLARCLAKLAPGGLAVFELPCHVHGYSFDLEAYLRGATRDPSGELHAVAQPLVLRLLAQYGFTLLEVVPNGRLETFGTSYLFVARKGRVD